MKDLSIIDQFQGFLNTPDIFPKNSSRSLKSFTFPELQITPELCKDLEKIDHPRNSVLGKRMESFFEIAVKHSDRYNLIASNIQIIEDKRTLGELDFLIFDKKRSKPLHIELVYKLYVYDEKYTSEIEKWIGPNRRDSFSKKLEKLEEKQFPLLYKKEASNYLQNLGLSVNDIEQQLCFKAQLYIPENISIEDQTLVNIDSLRGTWLKLDDFLQKNWKDNLFFSPTKKNWSCDPKKNSEWINQEQLLKEIYFLFEKKKAPLVWMKEGSKYYRFFIVWW